MSKSLARQEKRPNNLSHKPDYFLAGTVVFVLAIGILILSSVSAAISYERFGNTYYYLKHQLLFALLPGIALGLVAYLIDLRFLKKWSLFLFLGNLVLMAMVFLPGIGVKLGGAHRWLNLGFTSFQPSEFLKLSFIVYLASLLGNWQEGASRRNAGKSVKEFLLPFLIVFFVVAAFLCLQKDVSTLIIIFLIAATMFFSSSTPIWHTLVLALIAGLGLVLLVKFEPYRLARVLVFFNNSTNSMAEGYQLNQALISIGSGGISGIGLGMSRQRFGFLPEAMSDAIFPILAEETGFIGSIILIFLFLAFLVRGFRIIIKASNGFLQLVAIGVTVWIVSQAFINIAAMLGILPIAGIPLPFISYGGSALVSELIGIGLLLNISKQTI